MYIQKLKEMTPPPIQNTVGVCNQVTLLILYYTVEPRSIVPATIVFPHVLFAIFGPELSSI